ncbi:MAG: VWA domain-containing protein [Paracoccaceae bacterium]
MSDEFDRLRNAIRQATPEPDPNRKANDIARAMENFDRAQGSGAEARLMSDRPRFGARLRQGAAKMIHTLSTRGALAASTAIVALAVTFYVNLPELRNTGLNTPEFQTTAKLDETDAAAVAPAARDEGFVVANASEPAPEPEVGATVTQSAPKELSGLVLEEAERAGTDTVRFSADATVGVAPVTSPSMAERRAAPAAGGFSDTDMVMPTELNTETYANEAPNPLKVTSEEPVSTFSIDVDTASWGVIRSSLNRGQMPPTAAVRVEEMVNYFPYAYPAPEVDGPPFRPTVSVTQTPWNPGTEIVHIALQGRLPALDDRPPLNLIFLVDSSGSMDDPAKLPLLKQSLRLMLGELRPEDQVAIVTYAGAAGLVLEPTPARDETTILGALDRLSAGGSTAGQAGLEQAYSVAEEMAGDGEVTRVILATDGDFNVGLSDPAALEGYIARKRETGTYLSVLGFGRGNLDDATMQALAQKGNGMAAYIDTLAEARKVLVDQLTGALFPIADDVKIQVEFNPATVAEYRLIGYETRSLRREDFNNDKVDAGEIGAGHAVTALYEITPVDSDARLTDPLRYGARTPGSEDGELGFLKLRYKLPGEETSRLIEHPITASIGEATDDTRFATAIAGFGQLLTGSTYLDDWTYADAIRLAAGAKGDDPYGYRAEAVTLMRLAESLDR